MAVQILGLRDYFNKVTQKTSKAEAFFEEKWRAKSVKELFANVETYVAKIPEEERYNIYYTAASCKEARGRVLDEQNVIPIDIDNIDEDNVATYIKVVCDVVGRTHDNMAIVFSGNGLQFIIGIEEPIDSEDYFDENRVYYKALCDKIAKQLYLHGVTGDVDSSVFSKGRLLRLPFTKNIKPNKGEKEAKLLYGNIEFLPFDLVELSGIPKVEITDQVSDRVLSLRPTPDTDAVINGCDFLKTCLNNQEEVDEPQWYAMLSIVGRLDNGKELAHKFSNKHPEYNEHETNQKLHHALEASGPRTCSNIATLWDGCPSCKNYNKCTSPIMLESANHIKTQATGFYNISIGTDGQPKKGKPNYDDLMKHFQNNHPFVTMMEGAMVFKHNGIHWEDCFTPYINWFAEENFDPKPTQAMCSEFKSKLLRNNLIEPDFFNTTGMINFANGILDLDSMELLDHSDDYGFKYSLPFEYDPKADCPRFDKFLEEVTLNDESLKSVLLEYMGYALSGMDASLGQKALILVGEGSNGKSVFMDVLKYLAGKNNYSTLSMGFEINKLENRYQLDGKLFNISEETPTNAMMDSTVFKAIVTGGEVQARKLYCDAYSMKCDAKIIMACNELPNTKDLSYGMFRRLLIVPFNAKFTKSRQGYDPKIRRKLYGEASGIMNKAIQGLLRFKRNDGFTDSEAVETKINEYKLDNDPVAQWFEDCVVTDDEIMLPVSLMHKAFNQFAWENKYKELDVRSFGKKFRNLVNDDDKFIRTRLDGKLQRAIKGYKVTEEGGSF